MMAFRLFVASSQSNVPAQHTLHCSDLALSTCQWWYPLARHGTVQSAWIQSRGIHLVWYIMLICLKPDVFCFKVPVGFKYEVRV